MSATIDYLMEAFLAEKRKKEPELGANRELTRDQHVAVTAFINEKTNSEKDNCAICGSDDSFVVGNTYSLPVEANDGGYLLSGSYMPSYVTVCNNCGYVRLFSQKVIDSKLGGES